MEVPKQLGLTGRAIAEGRTVVSSMGSSEVEYSGQIDNAAKAKRVDSMVILPLVVSTHKKDHLKSKGRELVGVLQLLNYKGGDIARIDKVRGTGCDRGLDGDGGDGRYTLQVHMQRE